MLVFKTPYNNLYIKVEDMNEICLEEYEFRSTLSLKDTKDNKMQRTIQWAYSAHDAACYVSMCTYYAESVLKIPSGYVFKHG